MTISMIVAAGMSLASGVGSAGPVAPFQLADGDGNGFLDEEEAVRAFEEYDRDRAARLYRRGYRELERGAARLRAVVSAERRKDSGVFR
jgi:hypothetical protein